MTFNNYVKSTIFFIFTFFLAIIQVQAHEVASQDTTYQVFSIEEIFKLTEQNNQALKVSAMNVSIANQGIEIVKLQKLPTLSTSLSAGYLGDAVLIEKDFSSSTKVPMPNFANAFSVQASQLIFQGNKLNYLIESASLQEQLARLGVERNAQDIKLLVAGSYFDLYKLYNQRKVYKQNIVLAEARLKNIQKMYEQGMVTKNDIIRSELQLSNLKLAVVVIDNNINILNTQLTTAIGLSSTTVILPDTTLLTSKPDRKNLEYYQQDALKNDPENRLAAQNTRLAKKGLDIANAERSPILTAYGGNSLQRPVTSSNPALDMYANGWQAGLSLSFNIHSLYSAPRKIKQEKLKIEQDEQVEIMQKQYTSVAVNTAFVKHAEAISQSETLTQNKRLADENYRIIEKKYLNQLALLIDMLDATNAKLDAELQQANAEINIIYTHYALLKTTGRL